MPRPQFVAVLLGTVLAVSLSACSTATTAAPPAVAVVPAPTDVPAGAAPAAGTVVRSSGPFDDRFVLADLRLREGAVTGALRVTTDVSDVLVLEVHAAFYDEAGTLLGTAAQVRQDEEGDGSTGPPDESLDVLVEPLKPWAGRVASARVWVPVLVNE